MNLFSYFVLATLCLVTIISIIMGFRFRNKMNNMAGMMISMAVGMNVGLTAGLLFGSLYQGNLYYSTMISILAGIFAGTVCGLSFGILPTIDGFLAGLMGGMMGAMLGEMIEMNQAEILLNIFLTLSVCCLILFPILQESLEKETKHFWFVKPFLTFIFLAGYLLLGNQLNDDIAQSKSNNHISHKIHKGSKQQKITINVHPSHFSYDPQKIILKKKQEVLLTLNNHDSIEHDMEIKELPISQKENTKLIEKLHLHASPNNMSEIIFTPIEAGTFQFYCTIPGHRESGMVGIFIIK